MKDKSKKILGFNGYEELPTDLTIFGTRPGEIIGAIGCKDRDLKSAGKSTHYDGSEEIPGFRGFQEGKIITNDTIKGSHFS